MGYKMLWIGNRKYYYYDKYYSWDEAYKLAKHYQKKDRKCKWFITKDETFGFREKIYKLYLTRIIRLTFL